MDLSWVPHKTTLGQQEIAQRSGVLSSGERRLLILADGKRSLQELEKLCRAGEFAAQLERLLRLGFVGLPGQVGETSRAEVSSTASQADVASTAAQAEISSAATQVDVSSTESQLESSHQVSVLSASSASNLSDSAPADLPVASITLEIQRLNAALQSHDTQRYEAPPYQASFRQLKEQAAEELLVRSQYRSEVLAARIISCSTPKALRTLLRESDAELMRTMGEREAIEFARRIGSAAVNL